MTRRAQKAARASQALEITKYQVSLLETQRGLDLSNIQNPSDIPLYWWVDPYSGLI